MATPEQHVPLEVCVDSIASALAASEGGASRLEVCANLVEGGTTPSIGLVKAMLSADISTPLHVMLRPRGGDFLYSPAELDVMREDLQALKAAGAHGIVLGLLDADGHVDEAELRRFAELAHPLPVTFHRAIDVSADAVEAVHACIRCGVSRVLTSGAAPTACEGLGTLRRMVEAAGGRLRIAAAGGVDETNAQEIAATSGVAEVHGSLRGTVQSAMRWRPARSIAMGAEKRNDAESEFQQRVTNADRVAAVVRALDGRS